MPRGHLQHHFLTGENAGRSIGIATYLGLAAAFVPSVDGLATALHDRSYLTAGAWILFLGVVATWAIRSAIHKTYKPLTASKTFQPFAEPSKLQAWPRDRDVERIKTALKTDGALPIVIGESGVGKTTILRILLPEALKHDKVHVNYIDHYGDFFDTFPDFLDKLESEPETAPHHLIILDQFEQILAQLAEEKPEFREEQSLLLQNVIERARTAGAMILISLRYEWFYDLKVLGSAVPAPQDCIEISGPEPFTYNDPTMKAILRNYKAALRNDEKLARFILAELGERGSLLLLETQIVGATLESLLADGHPVTREYLINQLGGVGGAIDRYFEDVLAAAPDRRVAAKVLAALSTATRFRRQIRGEDVLDAVFEDPDAVRAAIDYMVDRRLVISRDG